MKGMESNLQRTLLYSYKVTNTVDEDAQDIVVERRIVLLHHACWLMCFLM